MTKSTIYWFGILATLVIGTYLYGTHCISCGAGASESDPSTATVASPKATSYPFLIADKDFSYRTEANYAFKKSSATIAGPVSDSLDMGLARLGTFLGANAERTVEVTGHYAEDEYNASAYPDLGLARANAVKNHMVSKGIPSEKIDVLGRPRNVMVPREGVFLGPVSFALGTRSSGDTEAIKALYDKITADPLVLYFDTAEATIDLNAAQRQKFADISRYLDKVGQATCLITGHSDNTGQASTNMRLGQQRADFAKDYLIGNGIPEARIKSVSMGEAQPEESNTNADGRAKNRRAVITLL